MPSPIAGWRGLFRRAGFGTSCVCLRPPILFSQVPPRPTTTAWAPLPLSWRRCSRYLPVARRSTVACSARRSGGSADFSRSGRPWWSWDEIQFLAHPSMLCDRGAGSMLSSLASPIGSQHPDLARPQQSRSCPLTALAVTRSGHAQNPLQGFRYGGDFQSFLNFARYADCDPEVARDWVSASAPSTGFRSHFKINSLAAHSGAHFSWPDQAFRASDRLARRRYPTLDRAAGGAGLIPESNIGDWLVAASVTPQTGRYRSTT